MTKVALICLVAITACWAVILHEEQTYPEPVRRIRGRVVADAEALRMNVDVTAFDHPEVWSDNSLTLEQKRKKQKKIAATWTDEDGKFALKGLEPGQYEVEFRKGTGGWNVLSVFIRVDPNGRPDDLCVQLGIESSEHQSSVVQAMTDNRAHISLLHALGGVMRLRASSDGVKNWQRFSI